MAIARAGIAYHRAAGEQVAGDMVAEGGGKHSVA